MIIDEELRAKVEPYLPKDYQKKGADQTGFSRSMIYKVLHEGQDNVTVSDWLIHTALKNKRVKERAEKKLSLIAKQL